MMLRLSYLALLLIAALIASAPAGAFAQIFELNVAKEAVVAKEPDDAEEKEPANKVDVAAADKNVAKKADAAKEAAAEEEMFEGVVDVVRAVQPVIDVAVGDPQLQQFRAQFEPLLKVELSFAARVSKPNEEERRQLIAKSNKMLDTVISEYRKQGGQANVDGVWMGGMATTVPDPRNLVEDGVKKVVNEVLSDEQAKLYSDECAKRVEFQKKVALDNLVSKIDGELMLSPEQREKLSKSLSKNWQKSWAPQLETFMFGGDYWPNVPDHLVKLHLTAAQQAAWSKIPKQSGNVFWGGAFFGMNGQVIDDIDLDAAKEKADDGDKKNEAAVAADGQAILAAPVAAERQ
jgi:hypothetical protein